MRFAVYNHRYVIAEQAKMNLKYKCPFCHRRLILHPKHLSRRAFFSHRFSSEHYQNPAETSEHLRGKQQLFKFLNPVCKRLAVEKYLSEINQWPDLITNHTVIEFQCSPISVEKLNQRIAGYRKLNVKSWWVLGRPYYQRRLRPGYLARFMNYSRHIGFFILYWLVNKECLEINYRIHEIGGHLRYRLKRFSNFQSLLAFIKSYRLKPYFISHRKLIQVIKSEISLNQRRLFHGDSQLERLQCLMSPKHNSLMCCPLICHVTAVDFPIFRNKALLWRIWILKLLKNNLSLNYVYRMANTELNLPLHFCQINGASYLYELSFKNYIQLLVDYHYVGLSSDGKKITWLKKPRWFSSEYDKLRSL